MNLFAVLIAKAEIVAAGGTIPLHPTTISASGLELYSMCRAMSKAPIWYNDGK